MSPFGRNANPKTRTPLLKRRVNNDLFQLILSLQDAPTQFVQSTQLSRLIGKFQKKPFITIIIISLSKELNCDLILVCEHNFHIKKRSARFFFLNTV